MIFFSPLKNTIEPSDIFPRCQSMMLEIQSADVESGFSKVVLYVKFSMRSPMTSFIQCL